VEQIIVALVTAAGLMITQVIISYRNNNVILYRLDRLEEKQDKHNSMIERLTVVEQSTKSAHHRIDGIARKE
jgi:cell division protein FtsL